MKVLIVDDERHVREAIRLLVDWESYGIRDIREAADGAEAVRMIEAEKPDIVFTDMLMPVMTGTELLEWMQGHCPGSKTIVVSGHDDFGYVRHTIKYGGMDYLLKPIDEEQLNEVLRKAVDAVRSEERLRSKDQSRDMQLNQIKPIYWDKVFTTLTEEPGVYASFAAELETEFGIRPDTGQVRAAVLSFETMQTSIIHRFASNLDLLSYSIANIANEFLSEERAGYAFRNWSKAHELVIVCWAGVERFPALARTINDGIYRTYGVRFDFGIGGVRRFPAELPLTYQEAIAALKQRNLMRKGERVYDDSTSGERPGPAALRFEKHQEHLRLAMLSGSEERMRSAVNAWSAELRALPVITVEQLDLWVHEFAVFRARCLDGAAVGPELAALPGALEPGSFVVPVDEDGRLSFREWQAELERFVFAFSRLLTVAARRSEAPTAMQEIADYIEQNYREELSLQEIADRFGLSREYISRRFKQERGENLSDFLLRTRIERAKLLLLNTAMRVAQVAEMVGYADEKYFSKVFKKAVGVSPNQYRRDN
ncbi:response regulator [Paenibacillus sp. TRM 82003]|nr:response regulator [Paenibacillus sp. TRM 82003]